MRIKDVKCKVQQVSLVFDAIWVLELESRCKLEEDGVKLGCGLEVGTMFLHLTVQHCRKISNKHC